jgi:hypothetical protein
MGHPIEATLSDMKGKDYDWAYVFNYASGFGVNDVEEVIASRNGESDGRDWCAVFHLKDGRYAYLSAGCDYTGWG